MTSQSIAALFLTMFALSVVPGPSDFAVVARSLGAGFGHALIMTCGIIAADFLFIILAVYSLSALADAMGGLFYVLGYVCGAYLIWLGVGSLRARVGADEVVKPEDASRWTSFAGGFLITLGDPKAILFYMGLFPAFLDLKSVTIADTVTIMVCATFAIGAVKVGYAFLADRARLFFNDTRMKRRFNVAAGCVLIGTGVFLLVRS